MEGFLHWYRLIDSDYILDSSREYFGVVLDLEELAILILFLLTCSIVESLSEVVQDGHAV